MFLEQLFLYRDVERPRKIAVADIRDFYRLRRGCSREQQTRGEGSNSQLFHRNPPNNLFRFSGRRPAIAACDVARFRPGN